jgi:hypothetical protein
MGPLFGLAASLALAAQLAMVRWQPARFIPKAADRAAGAALIARIRSTPGEVWVPAHPWYAHLAGKRPFVHRMGMKDVTYANKWQVAGLTDWLRDHRFSAIFLDNHDIHTEFPIVGRYYRRDDLLDRSQQPRLYAGARGVMPESIWVPAVAQPPPEGAKVLFDFEKGNYAGWDIQGNAWGRAPDSQALPDQGPVRRWGGRYFASSMHGGDRATGTLVSPGFEITGDWITFRMSGGADKESLIAELRVDGKPVRTASNPIASEKLTEQRWDVADLKGKTASLALVDHTSGAWGHLNFDELLIWTKPPP